MYSIKQAEPCKQYYALNFELTTHYVLLHRPENIMVLLEKKTVSNRMLSFMLDHYSSLNFYLTNIDEDNDCKCVIWKGFFQFYQPVNGKSKCHQHIDDRNDKKNPFIELQTSKGFNLKM